jgi:peroxidase
MSLSTRWFHRRISDSGRLRSRLACRLELHQLEERTSPTDVFRSIDGTGNNLSHLAWGSAGSDLLRLAPAAYANGISTPAGMNRPSARVVSNEVVDQGGEDIVSDRFLSAMIYAWGQFVDHDLDLTPNASPAEPFNVAVPSGDPSFDPGNLGSQVIPLNRSLSDPAVGNPRQQVNTITAWLDGSQIYGSDAATADKLRTHVGGRLKTSPGADGVTGTKDDMLPLNNGATFPTGTLPMANDAHLVPDNQLFAAGDVRANENIELTSLHTLFVREHNRIADAISRANPRISDEQIYQTARAQVIAELEAITYNEWLPALLGPNALRPYRGYNPNVNSGIANEFSTAAFRLGHSMLGDDVEFLGNNGLPVADEVPLSQAFFNPPLLTENGTDPVLKYLSSDPSSEVDTKVVDSVRNFLFGPPGAGGLDLASLNIQRGRDHGLADYNTIRAAYGLPRVTSFSQITSDADLQAKLQALYGNVNNIDAWVGMLAEDHIAGGSTGPLVRAVLVDQFTRLRDGDRYWYERTYSGRALQTLENTTLADVIRRNSTLTNLQSNVFFFRVGISGTVFNDANGDGRRGRNERPLGGQTVDLIDATSGDVIATTTADARGNYSFDVADGLGLRRYQVRVELPDGLVQTTPVSVISLTRGEVFVTNVDIGVGRSRSNAVAPSATSGSSATTDGQVDGTQLADSSRSQSGCLDEDTSDSVLTQSFVSPNRRS